MKNSLGSATERNFQPFYPDPHQRELKERLAEIKNGATERIVLGNGSDEVIDLVIRAFCDSASRPADDCAADLRNVRRQRCDE
jgi:histidinol-phosphate aminotransferase